jgi:hypothetical protein
MPIDSSPDSGVRMTRSLADPSAWAKGKVSKLSFRRLHTTCSGDVLWISCETLVGRGVELS